MDQIRSYIAEVQKTLDNLPLDLIEQVIVTLEEARLANHTVFIMGNGGSAATASHFSCDLAKNTRRDGWPNFRVMGLTDNMPVFSALANDDGYENVFSRQLESFVQPGDVVIGISTSGNSPNVVRAIQRAKQAKAITIGFTGFDHGQLGSLVDIDLHVPNCSIEQVEDIHLMLEHLITKSLRDRALSSSSMDAAVPVLSKMVFKQQVSELE
ncbi:MAG TPA: SIS domain-containing protein [Anaerolineales bacterium]|nr:SIS domain-containing protein [Anaerolineales bacterium]